MRPFPGPMGLIYTSFRVPRASQAEDRPLYLEPRNVSDPGREAVYVYAQQNTFAVYVSDDVVVSPAHYILFAPGLALPSGIQFDV